MADEDFEVHLHCPPEYMHVIAAISGELNAFMAEYGASQGINLLINLAMQIVITGTDGRVDAAYRVVDEIHEGMRKQVELNFQDYDA